jgi:phenylpropionate dioxygenase-like ring-hydroxylating dioxygenase large terminal subunit
MGQADKADPSLLPVGLTEERPGWSRVHGYLHVRANYQLVTDNLLDLTHVQFLHSFPATDRQPPAEFSPTIKAEQRGDTVYSINEFANSWMTPIYRLLWERGDAPEVCDLRANMRWDPPSALFLDTGACVANGARESGPSLMQAQWLTPETEFTTHYFWAVARDRYVEDAAMAERLKAGIDAAFRDEDEPMIEAVQGNMGTMGLWDAHPILLATDGAPIRARRIVERLFEAEREASEGARRKCDAPAQAR